MLRHDLRDPADPAGPPGGVRRGRANSLYVLCYYLGGTAGITASGRAFNAGGWRAVVGLGVAVIAAVFAAGIAEARASRRSGAGGEEDPGAGG